MIIQLEKKLGGGIINVKIYLISKYITSYLTLSGKYVVRSVFNSSKSESPDNVHLL